MEDMGELSPYRQKTAHNRRRRGEASHHEHHDRQEIGGYPTPAKTRATAKRTPTRGARPL